MDESLPQVELLVPHTPCLSCVGAFTQLKRWAPRLRIAVLYQAAPPAHDVGLSGCQWCVCRDVRGRGGVDEVWLTWKMDEHGVLV